MMTLRQFASPPKSIPAATSWYFADLGEARGKQELLTKQAPQRLKALREHALVESAVSSNRIEGVEVAPARVRTVVFGKSHARRIGQTRAVRGEKRSLIIEAVALAPSDFSVADLQRTCPGVGVDMIRRVLRNLRDEGKVTCVERGRNARWKKLGTV